MRLVSLAARRLASRFPPSLLLARPALAPRSLCPAPVRRFVSSASSSAAAAMASATVGRSDAAPTAHEQPQAGSLSNASMWLIEGPPQPPTFPPVKGDVGEFDVCVVGGGIYGLTSAYLLKKAGKKVAVVESRRVGAGTTGSSTCKLSADQQLVYSRITDQHGEKAAQMYGEMQLAAIKQVEEIVQALGIQCDFARKFHASWTSEASKVKDIKREAELAAKLGMPAEYLEGSQLTELPHSIKPLAGVKFHNQAELNAYKFCVQLARHIDGDGCKVFESSMVSSVSDSKQPHEIVADSDQGKLHATHVILATHLPILDRSGHFALLPPSKSHVVAVKLAKQSGEGKEIGKVGAGQLRNMYINVDPVKRSIRTLQDASILIVSGESFETGDETDVEYRYKALEDWAHEHFDVERNLTRWSAMDYFSSAVLPYIGLLYRGTSSIYTGTGFSKWGLTNGVAAAMICRDLIQGVKNPWSDLVDARRWDLHAASGAAMENWHTTKHFVGDKIKAMMAPDISTLKRGEGGLVKVKGEQVGAYLDMDGKYHLVKPICTHLGCHILWNKTDRTWDCPCHGSQFSFNGEVIHGPACKNLCKRDDLKW